MIERLSKNFSKNVPTYPQDSGTVPCANKNTRFSVPAGLSRPLSSLPIRQYSFNHNRNHQSATQLTLDAKYPRSMGNQDLPLLVYTRKIPKEFLALVVQRSLGKIRWCYAQRVQTELAIGTWTPRNISSWSIHKDHLQSQSNRSLSLFRNNWNLTYRLKQGQGSENAKCSKQKRTNR